MPRNRRARFRWWPSRSFFLVIWSTEKNKKAQHDGTACKRAFSGARHERSGFRVWCTRILVGCRQAARYLCRGLSILSSCVRLGAGVFFFSFSLVFHVCSCVGHEKRP
ncbi:uncharacterized protein K452DRAFT_60656 [Aplosporella prunicola CBS 121167]|uniref:Uncharacterized protein n=1 Tax=Aplosporella prunicola CBS 121167 TaxID=1176127 RepID=A0A6A6B7P5_9PEZI|nr:uncharacterized protein K452DRAFT_60656 [Aplosporella prunicola CBS 121167]KAF2140090.1 hypothetical protein K452DRAFT_60656 [Aplosporella prunicola CBS 121167]